MNTNFFTQLASLSSKGNWRIAVSNVGNGCLVVSVLLVDEGLKDEAAKSIPPMILKGTASEIDEGFFIALEKPIAKTVGLFANIEQYETAVDEAEKQLRMEREKKQKAQISQPVQDEQTRKFETIMKKVEVLQAEEKYGEAIAQLPKVDLFPEQEEAINLKKDELWELRNTKENTLF
jgi:PRTRC genetic system protein E